MKILVAIVAYNEEENIARVIQGLRSTPLEMDIIVIDNGSTDNTVAIGRDAGVPVVAHTINTGSPYGTVMSYFLYADQGNYDVVCQIDGDNQHVAEYLRPLVAEIANGADYVIGSRFIRFEGFQSSKVRLVGILYLSSLLSFVIGQRITDPTSGFKAYSKNTIRYFSRNYRKEIYDGIQMLLLSRFHGMKIVEIPVTMRSREFGVSEFNLYRSIAYPIKASLTIAAHLISDLRH